MLTAHAIGDRYIVPREWFTQHDPDPKRRLSVGAARRLLAWYALRAARPSWPDELERRLRGAKAALLDALTPLADDIAEVRVAIDERDEELPADQPYHLVVFFVVDEDVWNADVPGRAAIYDAFTRFVTALAGCDGIEVNTDRSEVVSGAVFTWQEARATDEWNFANLSHREPCGCRDAVRSHQPDPAGQQRMHHALLEQAGLVAAGFEGGEFGVHVGKYRPNGHLLIQRRQPNRDAAESGGTDVQDSIALPEVRLLATYLRGAKSVRVIWRAATNRGGSLRNAPSEKPGPHSSAVRRRRGRHGSMRIAPAGRGERDWRDRRAECPRYPDLTG